jgi:hypothetical protein
MRAHIVRWLGVLAAVFLLTDLAIPMAIDPHARAFDFAPFYCAGEAVAQGADPYRAMPLGACEHRVATGPFFASGVVMPAPLPPYALAVLRVVAMLPFETAQRLLDWASLVSFALSAYLLRRITALPFAAIVFAMAPIAWVVLALGQTLLVMLCALTVCATLLARGHDRWAALAASVLMVEPHVGVAVCASLFVWRARTRPVFLATAAVLATTAVSVLSWPVVVEYFTTVLPLHARSEVFAPAQLSLTSALAALGVPVGTALRLGALQYGAGVIAGVAVARALELRLGVRAAVALVPPLFAVAGGTFIHATDFMLAVPAALLIAANTRWAALATLATIAIGAHWIAVGGLPGPLLTIVSGPFVVYARHRLLLPALTLGAAFALAVALLAMHPQEPRTVLAAVAPADFAEVSWGNYVGQHAATTFDFMVRLPMWSGLIALCALAVHLAAGRREKATRTRGLSPAAGT